MVFNRFKHSRGRYLESAAELGGDKSCGLLRKSYFINFQ